jgi:enoyl-CoA hydratase/carnithine racemase
MRFEKPIVSKVNGHAMGGGLGLVAASHFAIASTEAKLGTPEIDVGLFPFMIMAVLARTMPRRALVEMMLLGKKLSADEATRFGVIGQCVAPDALDKAVADLCAALVKKSPTATKLGLRALAAQSDLDLETALPMLRDNLAECLGTDDAREGLTAFLEKREPKWTGK